MLNVGNQSLYGEGTYNDEFGNIRMRGKNKEINEDKCLDELRMLMIDVLYPKCDNKCSTSSKLVCYERCINLQQSCGDLLLWVDYDSFWNKWNIDGVQLNMTFDHFERELISNQTKLGLPIESVETRVINLYKSLITYKCDDSNIFSNSNTCVNEVIIDFCVYLLI